MKECVWCDRLAGALQLIYRPGWDGADDVGDDGPINGGRWAPAPWTGAGVTSSLIGPINRHHKYGDEDDANYAFAQKVLAGDYSFIEDDIEDPSELGGLPLFIENSQDV